ncbi:putative prophage protein [Salmonella enterica subsp. enterica serovar Typhimurium]|nr:putative prophage protein [Salmonella enterica subsp. enterica serovar Typhimurium]
MPKIKTAVALGLPVSLAKCLTEMNNIRNKYAHKIEYIITDEDAERIDSLIMSVPVDDINHASLIDSTLITSITNLGASSIAFMNDIPKDFLIIGGEFVSWLLWRFASLTWALFGC